MGTNDGAVNQGALPFCCAVKRLLLRSKHFGIVDTASYRGSVVFDWGRE